MGSSSGYRYARRAAALRISRRALLLAAAVLLPLVLAPLVSTPAYAYPIVTGPLTVVGTLAPGSTVTVSGTGYTPGAGISTDVMSEQIHIVNLVADPSGSISATVTIPTNLDPGEHDLRTTGSDPNGNTLILMAKFVVAGLPVTGDRVARIATAGALILLLGTAIVLVSMIRIRRRRAGNELGA